MAQRSMSIGRSLLPPRINGSHASKMNSSSEIACLMFSSSSRRFFAAVSLSVATKFNNLTRQKNFRQFYHSDVTMSKDAVTAITRRRTMQNVSQRAHSNVIDATQRYGKKNQPRHNVGAFKFVRRAFVQLPNRSRRRARATATFPPSSTNIRQSAELCCTVGAK